MSVGIFTILLTVFKLAAAPRHHELKYGSFGFEFEDKEQGNYVRYRFIDMTRVYYEEGMARVKRLNVIRLKYEETPLFEMGYVIGEIIERYRKMVELAKYMEDYQSEIVLKRAALLNIIEQTYLEMYHIYNIFHEIPHKYSYIPEFRNISALFDSTIEALDQRCDEYDQTCRTNTTMTNVWQAITEQRERDAEASKEYKRGVKKFRNEFIKAYINDTLDELKKDLAARNLSWSSIYSLDHVPGSDAAASKGVQDIYSNPQRGFENLIKWKRPNRPKKRRPYPIEYGWSKEDVVFEGWAPNETEDNRSYIYLHYIPPPPNTTLSESEVTDTSPAVSTT